MSEKKDRPKNVVTGGVMKPKESTFKRIYHIFFAMDPQDVAKNVLTRVILPDIQYSLNNIWKRAGEIWFWGIGDESSSRGRSSRTAYDRVLKKEGRTAFQNESRRRDRRSTRVDEFKEWGFERKKDVDNVILGLEEDINDYEEATVARLYELAGETPESIHFDWGWVKGDEFDYEMGRDGLWHILFPKLKRLPYGR